MKYTVRVTQSDIDNGVRENPVSCPVARAIARATGKRVDFVGPVSGVSFVQDVYIPWGDAESEKIRGFIVDFDNGDPVRPIEFELAVGE
jgi:hypothetical protein